MQVEMPISNGTEADLHRGRARASRFSLRLMLVLVCGVASAQAQNDLTQKPSPSNSSSATAPAATEQTRVRRVAEAPETTSGDSTKASGSAKETSSAGGKTGGDRLTALRAQIEEARTNDERMRLQRTLVDYLIALNRQTEAINELRAMAREERLDPIGFYNIGNALARLGDTDTAIDAYRKAIKQHHGNYSRALNNLGVVLLRQGRWDEAQEALTSALQQENFHYAEASYNLGRLYSLRGEAALAIREFSRALTLQPDHADAAIALARAYAEDGSPEQGIAVLDNFISHRGSSNEMATARREIMFGNTEATNASLKSITSKASPATSVNSSAIVVTRDTTETFTDNASTRKAATARADSSKRAATSLRTLTIDPETYDLLQRAREAREGERNAEAVTLYRRVLARSDGLFPPANLELSFVLINLNRGDEAIATLTTLADREGARYPIAYYHIGRQQEALGRLSLAANAYEKAAAAYGDTNPQFLLDLSRVREKEGNVAAALAAMEDYVRISRNLGGVPYWSAARLAQLRQKVTASSTSTPKER